jgi:hypothetical protein
VIVADRLALFAEFHGKRFPLLRGGSRDGFGARLSQPLGRPCVDSGTDPGQEDMGQFQGFTPVKSVLWLWNGEFGSASNLPKADPSLRIFLFKVEESAQSPISICAEGRKESPHKPLLSLSISPL